MIRSKFETQDKRSEDVFVNHFVEKKPVNDQDKQAEAKAKEELIKRVFGEIKPGKPYNSNSSKWAKSDFEKIFVVEGISNGVEENGDNDDHGGDVSRGFSVV